MKKLTTIITVLTFSCSLISMAHAHQSEQSNLYIDKVGMVKLSNNNLVTVKKFEGGLKRLPEDIRVESESTQIEFTAEELMDIEKFETELIKLDKNSIHNPKL